MNKREALLLALLLVPEIAPEVALMCWNRLPSEVPITAVEQWGPGLGLFDSIDETGHLVVGIPLEKVTNAALKRLADDPTDASARDVVVRAALVYEAWISDGDIPVRDIAGVSGIASLRDYRAPLDERVFDGWGHRTNIWLADRIGED